MDGEPSMDPDTYLKERSSLIEVEHSSSDQHDKAALTLSAGALGLSVTFLEKIAPAPTPCTSWLVLLAWLCFIGSITSALASFHFSQIACRKQREILDELYRSRNPDVDQLNRFSAWTEKFNYSSFGLFIVGVLILTLFAWLNFPKGR